MKLPGPQTGMPKGIALRTDVKRWFFRENTSIFISNQKRMKALRYTGAFVMKTARRRIRRRKRISRPGESPSSHTGLLRDNIFFAMSQNGRSVVIGPMALNTYSIVGGKMQRGGVPNILEFGGTQHIRERRYKGVNPKTGQPFEWHRLETRRTLRDWEESRKRKAVYYPRPFMGPALKAANDAGVAERAWSKSIVGA
jgi:hypothetical protein